MGIMWLLLFLLLGEVYRMLRVIFYTISLQDGVCWTAGPWLAGFSFPARLIWEYREGTSCPETEKGDSARCRRHDHNLVDLAKMVSGVQSQTEHAPENSILVNPSHWQNRTSVGSRLDSSLKIWQTTEQDNPPI